MEAGWGFHVPLKTLAKAAYIWPHVQTFMLVRARHAAELGSANVVNLASLPQEVIEIIEDELVMHAYELVSVEEPFLLSSDLCVEFRDHFHSTEAFEVAFNTFRASYVHSLHPIDEIDNDNLGSGAHSNAAHALETFQRSAEYIKLSKAYMSIHQFENGCKDCALVHIRFWDAVNDSISSFPCVMYDGWVSFQY
jgi:hypothetical protein